MSELDKILLISPDMANKIPTFILSKGELEVSRYCIENLRSSLLTAYKYKVDLQKLKEEIDWYLKEYQKGQLLDT